jgi:hypothetical protein
MSEAKAKIKNKEAFVFFDRVNLSPIVSSLGGFIA